MGKLAVYNENCVMAGLAVPQQRLDDTDWESDDWTVFEGTAEELLQEAEFHEGRGLHGARVAATLRDYAEWL